MATSLSKLVDNLTEGIHSDKCINCKSDISYMKVIDETLIFRCFNCKRNYKKEIDKELIERFASTYKFCNNDLNKFVMLLRKGVYPYEYMAGWDKFNETSIPSKESFYSNLTMENIMARRRRYKRQNMSRCTLLCEESSYIQYLDANNLYGTAMSEKLPINGFKWVNDISGINEKFVKSYDKKNSDKGYILEVDVDYPSKLHKLHNDLPFFT